MKEFVIKTKEWWFQLSHKEKRYCFVGSIFVSMFIIYQWILTPSYQAIDDMRTKIINNEKLLTWMQTIDLEIKQALGNEAQKRSEVRSIASQLRILKQILTEKGFSNHLSSLKQTTQSNINLQLKDVEFDKFIQFLMDCSQQYQITVSQMSVTLQKSDGLVNVDVTFKI